MSLVLLQLIGLFAGLSMLAFGGGAGVIPDMQRAAVDHYHWLTAREFLDSFAISRAAPGPGSLIVVLVGLKAAGMVGAAVSFAAMFAPSCLAVHIVAKYWHRAARSAWRAVVERALAPVAVGLTFASGLSLMRGTEHGSLPWGITIVSTAAFSLTEVNPILLLAAGAGTLLLMGP
ncbi:MAG: chromate transporter [Acetobacteraceae bacterium]|jgi:chromate transporter|nr:Chromate transport protein [Rhodopila sp.]MEA2727986.1 chromate transporter [Acetobacteraceae bacterium]MEA2767154.1 chromate transporter [Acetobacteraceae bacterium]